jgi:hypothetical protein
MYDFEWHKSHGDKTTSSAETIIDIIARFVDIDDVLDVGCGDGRWLSVCRAKGAAAIAGVDGPWTDLDRLLIPADTVTIHELSESFDLRRRFSLAISLEVAEHVGERSAEVFIDNLVRHSDVILFGAAIPYQGGFRHINEQWQSYWSGLFNARGFGTYDVLRSQVWDDANVHFWYRQNAIIYVNEKNTDAISRVSNYVKQNNIQQIPLDVVHPEKFKAVASYKQIAFKPLARELPRQTARKFMSIVRNEI